MLGSVFMDPLLALLGTRSTDGALYAATRDYLQILVAATPLFYLSNVFNYYLRNDGSQRRAGAGSVIGNLCDIALNITLVLALDMARGARRCPPRWDRSSPSPSICRAFSVRSTRCASRCRAGAGSSLPFPR